MRRTKRGYAIERTNALSLPLLVRNISLQTSSLRTCDSASFVLSVSSSSSSSSSSTSTSSFVSYMLAPYTYDEVMIDVRGVLGGCEESGFIWNPEDELASNDDE